MTIKLETLDKKSLTVKLWPLGQIRLSVNSRLSAKKRLTVKLEVLGKMFHY